MVVITSSIPLIFQIFLKVAEESGVDAETSGNPPGGCALWAVPPAGRPSAPVLAFPFELFYYILIFSAYICYRCREFTLSYMK